MKKYVCPNCGYVGKPKVKIKGSFAVELVLWLLFIVPGLIYSIWRYSGKYYSCPKCGYENMIPADSPRGRKLIREYSEQNG